MAAAATAAVVSATAVAAALLHNPRCIQQRVTQMQQQQLMAYQNLQRGQMPLQSSLPSQFPLLMTLWPTTGG
jgi:hypothetical protein